MTCGDPFLASWTSDLRSDSAEVPNRMKGTGGYTLQALGVLQADVSNGLFGSPRSETVNVDISFL